MMFTPIAAVMAFTTTLVAGAAVLKPPSATILPKFDYQSNFEVLSCKTNTDRVAFFPFEANCDSLCYKVTNPANGKSVNVLHVHQSQTDHALSAAAWKTLTGTEPNTKSKGVKMNIESVPGEKCFDVMTDNPDDPAYISSKIPATDKVIGVQRANSNQVHGGPLRAKCYFKTGEDWGTWVSKHLRYRNYWDVQCKTGSDDHCGYVPSSFWLTTSHVKGMLCDKKAPLPPSGWYAWY